MIRHDPPTPGEPLDEAESVETQDPAGSNLRLFRRPGHRERPVLRRRLSPEELELIEALIAKYGL